MGMAAILAFSGCQDLHFYGQAVMGEMEIVGGEQPVAKLLADPGTPDWLKVKFEEVNEIRAFARDQLHLPANGAYVSYTELHRSNVVWNVNVAPRLSLDPKTWWYPVVGEASYRGYFHEASARRYARQWEKKGWDVYVDGVEAYSTLGWFNDPLLSSFIDEPESYLAELIFHELGHRRLFIQGDTDFNEAFATEVADEGVKRWFAASGKTNDYVHYQAQQKHDHQFVDMVLDARQQLDLVYKDAHLTDAEKLRRKAEVIARLRANYAVIKASWNGDTSYDRWFSEPINNAKLNTISAYYDLTPAFAALLREDGGDLEKFYGAVAALGKMPIAQRHEALRRHLPAHPIADSH
jgi:predicted aminopeptidase